MKQFVIVISFLGIFSAFIPMLKGEETDSLSHVLANAKKEGWSKIYNDFAWKVIEEKPEQAIRYASEALKLAREMSSNTEEARALYIMADASYFLDNLDEAIRFYLASAEIEKKAGGVESEGYVNRIGDAGYCFYITDRHLEALKYLQESLELSLKMGYDSQAASMYSNIGSIYTEWGDYNKGLENNQKALEIDRRIGDPAQVSTDLNNIGKIYEQWGRFDEALNYYRDALEIARNIGNQSMIAIRLNNIAIVYKAKKQYTEALEYFQQALEIERSQGNMAKVGRRLSYIASTYLLMGQLEACLSYLHQSAPILEKAGLYDDLARLYNMYGKYYAAIGDLQQAISNFQRSQNYAAKNNLRPLQMANLESLADACSKSGQHDRAYVYLKQFVELKDSIFSAETNLKMAEFQARFENEKMKLENEILRQDVKMKRNLYLLSGTIGVSLVLILLAVIVILRLKNRNSLQAKELAEKNVAKFRDDLETKNRELALQAMMIIKSNESIAAIIEGLDRNQKNGQQAEELDAVLNQVRQLEKDKSWKEFEAHFTQVHSDFYQKLHEKFPDLTPNERKLCAFLRLNMTTKDIASITHQSAHSINVARTRLRRKMNLANSEENLISYLMDL